MTHPYSHKTASQRFTGIAVVVVFHVVVVYVLATGLGQSIVQVVTGPIETKVIEEQEEVIEEPPPPPEIQKLEEPPPFVPPPEINVAVEPTPTPTKAITQVQSATPTPAPVAVHQPVVETPKIAINKSKIQPEYPSMSRRMGEEGVVTLSIYVKEDGRVGEVKIKTSSGFKRLDEAAMKYVKRVWRFKPATRDGQPQAMWIDAPIRFQLK